MRNAIAICFLFIVSIPAACQAGCPNSGVFAQGVAVQPLQIPLGRNFVSRRGVLLAAPQPVVVPLQVQSRRRAVLQVPSVSIRQIERRGILGRRVITTTIR